MASRLLISAVAGLALSTTTFAQQGQFGTAQEARAMLDKAVVEGFVTPESRARWRNADSVASVMRILEKEGLTGEGIP